jgi:hypothetical protein
VRLLNPHLESLPEGDTVVACEVLVEAGREAYTQVLRFTVRLDRARVERLIADVGPERAIWLLWSHFRRLNTIPSAADSEHASLQDWAKAVDVLLAEIEQITERCREGPVHP